MKGKSTMLFLKKEVPEARLELAHPIRAQDFKSCASTNSATRA